MNKVITINLNGVAYQLEEGGYDALRAYLDNAARRLEGNPDRDEIIADIEQAIADKFRALLGAYKTVVNTKEVAAVLTEMGPVEDAAGDTAADTSGAKPGAAASAASEGMPPPSFHRLYRITDGAMLAGVCNGLAAYLGIDVTIVRLLFALLTLLWGAGVLVYLLMAVIVPAAQTPAEKAAATGMAATAQEFIKRAREGYYEGLRSFRDKQAHRAWKRKFKHEMRAWKHDFRREMRERSWQWSPGGVHPWAHRPFPVFGAVFVAPIIALVRFVVLCATIYAVFSLVSGGQLLGVALPAGLPVWVAVALVVLAYLLVSWPLRVARYACYYPGPYAVHAGPFGGVVGLAGLAIVVLVADRHSAHFHEWLQQIPPFLHHVVDTVQAWWARQT
jgi:phage shock protein PspC (stress-responsive transcriptional regulator)